ncbi:hypothetical protein UlMin_017718 [Ulmus minor]
MARSSSSVATTVLVATLLLFSTGVLAQAPASAPGAAGPAAPASVDCFTLLSGMADCLSYVTKGSNLTVPEKPCCPELKTLVDTNATCLCELLAQSANYGLEIDLKRATKLPSVCKVDTPPISTCAALGIPVAAPGAPLASPAPSPGGEPSAVSAGAPSPTKNNAASAVAVPSVLALLLVFALSFLPTFF